MFCKNCGSELSVGAKFCSECGTKVEEVIVRDFDTLTFEETAKIVEDAPSAEVAFKERVSFDWSNVIDEPQKRDIPQGIKSPWAATTDAINERELYEEMTQSDDKNRTMSFIDVLKADKEERERAAVERSIEYTEVLELDPELLGGTKPPKMHIPPLYDDADEPVRTPFDDMSQTTSFDTGAFDAPELDVSELEPAIEIPKSEPVAAEPEAGRFELPDFLKRAVGFGAAKETIERIEKETEFAEDEPVADGYAIDEPVADEPAADEPRAFDDETSSDLYLDEDIYLDMEERAPRAERMSRVDAHTLAGDYDLYEEETEEAAAQELIAEEPAPSFDENELFSEMAETPGSRSTGMTIAAPADEEEEIEALKRRLAELTGTLEIDHAELENAEAEVPAPEIHIGEEVAAETAIIEEPIIEAPKFEDFMFEPEVTPADDALFEGLTPAAASNVSITEVAVPAVAAAATYAVAAIDFEPPAPSISDDQKLAFESLNFDIPAEPEVVEPTATEKIFAEPEIVEPAVTEKIVAEPEIVEPVVAEPEPPKVERPIETEAKASDAFSLEELEKDLFGDSPEDVAEIETKKIDKFYTLYRKNEEFQRLLDEEYSKLKGEQNAVLESDDYATDDEGLGLVDDIAVGAEKTVKEEVNAAAPAFSLDDFITEENARPVEDATIYQEMPEEFKEAVSQAEAPKAPTFGLDGTETLGAVAAAGETGNAAAAAAVAAGAAAVAGAAASAAGAKDETKASAMTAKEEARAAKKAAKEAKKAEKAAAKASATADPQVEYENVDGGSTVLTILAVLVAILLVVLLVVILILHVAPGSDLALKIDDFIQNFTERFSMINIYRGMRVL